MDVGSLQECTEYEIRGHAQNNRGASDWSKPIRVLTRRKAVDGGCDNGLYRWTQTRGELIIQLAVGGRSLSRAFRTSGQDISQTRTPTSVLNAFLHLAPLVSWHVIQDFVQWTLLNGLQQIVLSAIRCHWHRASGSEGEGCDGELEGAEVSGHPSEPRRQVQQKGGWPFAESCQKLWQWVYMGADNRGNLQGMFPPSLFLRMLPTFYLANRESFLWRELWCQLSAL